MLNEINACHNTLINSNKFKNNGFLCSFFSSFESENESLGVWQIDFYNEDSDTITSYLMDEEIVVTENSKVFKKEDTKIEKLELIGVKISFSEALKKCKTLLNNQEEKPIKVIVVLQTKSFPIWNISYVTQKFNLLNIKVDSRSGDILENTSASLLSFGSLEKGNASKSSV